MDMNCEQHANITKTHIMLAGTLGSSKTKIEHIEAVQMIYQTLKIV